MRRSVEAFVASQKPLVHIAVAGVTVREHAVVSALVNAGLSSCRFPGAPLELSDPDLLETRARRYVVHALAPHQTHGHLDEGVLPFVDALLLCIRPGGGGGGYPSLFRRARALGAPRLLVLMSASPLTVDALDDHEGALRAELTASGFDGDEVPFVRWPAAPDAHGEAADELLERLERHVAPRAHDQDAPLHLRVWPSGNPHPAYVLRGRAPADAALDLVLWGEEQAAPWVLPPGQYIAGQRDAFGCDNDDDGLELTAGQLARVALTVPEPIRRRVRDDCPWLLAAHGQARFSRRLRVRVRALPQADDEPALVEGMRLRFTGHEVSAGRSDHDGQLWAMPSDDWLEVELGLGHPVSTALARRFAIYAGTSSVPFGYGEVLEHLDPRLGAPWSGPERSGSKKKRRRRRRR